MPKFYFTYGTDPTYPFQGGWAEIEALDWHTAYKAFRAYHPGHAAGTDPSNYAESYCEAEFLETEMAAIGNFGNRCHERIVVNREVFSPESGDG